MGDLRERERTSEPSMPARTDGKLLENTDTNRYRYKNLLNVDGVDEFVVKRTTASVLHVPFPRQSAFLSLEIHCWHRNRTRSCPSRSRTRNKSTHCRCCCCRRCHLIHCCCCWFRRRCCRRWSDGSDCCCCCWNENQPQKNGGERRQLVGLHEGNAPKWSYWMCPTTRQTVRGFQLE